MQKLARLEPRAYYHRIVSPETPGNEMQFQFIHMTSFLRRKMPMLVAVALLFQIVPAPAQWSVRVDEGKTPKEMFAADDPRRNLPDYLFQPFTTREWEASNFAPASDTAR